jgi:hypothetical protein
VRGGGVFGGHGNRDGAADGGSVRVVVLRTGEMMNPARYAPPLGTGFIVNSSRISAMIGTDLTGG